MAGGWPGASVLPGAYSTIAIAAWSLPPVGSDAWILLGISPARTPNGSEHQQAVRCSACNRPSEPCPSSGSPLSERSVPKRQPSAALAAPAAARPVAVLPRCVAHLLARVARGGMEIRHKWSTPASRHQPMEPSIWRVMSRLSSTAYSIGSSLVNASKKPLTMSALAAVSVSPRLCK